MLLDLWIKLKGGGGGAETEGKCRQRVNVSMCERKRDGERKGPWWRMTSLFSHLRSGRGAGSLWLYASAGRAHVRANEC